jgi:benzoate membrane transport protein
MSMAGGPVATGRVRLLPPLSMVVPLTIIFVAVLAIPLATAQALDFTTQQTGAWLFALYGLTGVLSLILTLVYQQPLLLGWNGFVVAFFASLAGQVRYPDLLGATLVGGAAVALLGALGLTARVAALVPAPVVFAVVAASVLPFVVGVFDALGNEPAIITGTFLAYVLGRRFLSTRIPPILPALVVGLVLTGVTGRFGALPVAWTAPPLALTVPTFSLESILTVVPVFVALTALQANLTAVVYLRSQGYRPPARLIDVASGLGSVVGAVLGPVPVCLISVLTPLTAGPEAGEREVRHWSVYAAGTVAAMIAIGAGTAARLPLLLPLPLLLAGAGLALIGVLAQALAEMVRGPLLLGPLFAFVAASSHLALFGLGSLFWALVIGTGVSLVLEADALRQLRTTSGTGTGEE